MPIMVLAFFVASAVWAVLMVVAVRTSRFRNVIWFGIGLTLFLNLGYFVRGQSESIAYFISLYDVLINAGLSSSADLPAAVATCAGNECTLWGDTYERHSAWGTAFHERFADGSSGQRALLYSHIGFNTVAFVLAHVQIAKPGTGGAANARRHQLLGRVGFVAVSAGTLSALWLATQHGSVPEYGGVWSAIGFFSMAFFVFATAVRTATTARSGDIAAHRVWMFRYLGAMWGAFWLFRLMLFVLDPLLRGVEGAAFLLCVWLSAPLGIVLSELIRTRRGLVRRHAVAGSTTAPV